MTEWGRSWRKRFPVTLSEAKGLRCLTAFSMTEWGRSWREHFPVTLSEAKGLRCFAPLSMTNRVFARLHSVRTEKVEGADNLFACAQVSAHALNAGGGKNLPILYGKVNRD